MTHLLLQGDARHLALPDRSVHCVVTSPPFFGLRDYGVSGQIGLEETPEEYVEGLVEVFRDVKRVLRDDGTFWLNIGDSYASSPCGNKEPGGGNLTNSNIGSPVVEARWNGSRNCDKSNLPGIKQKDLIGIPWMLAFALRDDGWYLRSDCIWSKPNPMRESVTDRPTKSHEYLFLFSKKPRYYYDAHAIKVASKGKSGWDKQRARGIDTWKYNDTKERHSQTGQNVDSSTFGDADGSNKLSVWTITTRPLKLAHFATFPPKLVEPCIKAGSSERGVCPRCGAPWRRVVEKVRVPTRPGVDTKVEGLNGDVIGNRDPQRHVTSTQMVGWESSCTCLEAKDPVPATILDPFAGAGTTVMVAELLGRNGIGIDLKREYLDMAEARIAKALEATKQPPRTRRPRPKAMPTQTTLF